MQVLIAVEIFLVEYHFQLRSAANTVPATATVSTTASVILTNEETTNLFSTTEDSTFTAPTTATSIINATLPTGTVYVKTPTNILPTAAALTMTTNSVETTNPACSVWKNQY